MCNVRNFFITHALVPDVEVPAIEGAARSSFVPVIEGAVIAQNVKY